MLRNSVCFLFAMCIRNVHILFFLLVFLLVLSFAYFMLLIIGSVINLWLKKDGCLFSFFEWFYVVHFCYVGKASAT